MVNKGGREGWEDRERMRNKENRGRRDGKIGNYRGG
jgi:hypothetical protein